MDQQLIDHLFRHQSGKMVSVLTRIFGLKHLDIIEDAVQDTFVKASISWRRQLPDNPEAWLVQASKNRVLDIFKRLQTEKKNLPLLRQGIDTIAIHELFLETEVEDAQLRMIFTACHPKLDPRDRISFALKTVSGFSTCEIASALLMKEQSVHKRLHRARKAVQKSKMDFRIPRGQELPARLESVLEVIYLIFNEGFHSNRAETLVRKDLCIEAMRLCQLLLKKEQTRSSNVYALLALMAFHAARLDTKTDEDNVLHDLKSQDRGKWHYPFVELGNTMMNKAVKDEFFSPYHYEAAIAAEHVKARRYEDTNWDKILYWYQCMFELQPLPIYLLTMAVVCIQKADYSTAKAYLDQIQPAQLNQRAYLFYGAMADYHLGLNENKKAIDQLEIALKSVQNKQEKDYLLRKKQQLVNLK